MGVRDVATLFNRSWRHFFAAQFDQGGFRAYFVPSAAWVAQMIYAMPSRSITHWNRTLR